MGYPMITPVFCRQAVQRLLWLLLWLAAPLVAQAADINAVRLWRAPDNTRLVFDLSGPVEHRVFPLKPDAANGDRLVVDISGVTLKADLGDLELKGTPIKGVRSAVQPNGDLRVVFDLAAAVRPRSFILKPNETYGDRLVLDLFDNTVPASTPVKTVEDSGNQQQRDIVIAIDAGHGGEDPGAIGPKRVREKDVVLAIAKELEALFRTEKGYRAVLVRKGDYYIPLERRRDIAREHRADFFVSIHADAFTKPSARGSSVFAVSDRGATSTMGRFLAEKENAADLVGGVSLAEMDHQLRQVMLDLSMTHTLRSSLDAGSMVLKRMGHISTLHSHKVEQAGFAVLKNPDIPSLLVETGFISNPEEARLLSSTGYRKKMAKAIFDGVNEHFHRSPPDGTYIAWKQKGGKQAAYTIQPGDTLSEIARRHAVSLPDLQRANGLDGDTIRVGQLLVIPAS